MMDKKTNSSKTQDNFFSFHCGIVIKNIRKAKNITGTELAKKLNISQQQMSRYERGINKFNIDMLFNISAALDTNFEQLIRSVFSEIRKNDSEAALILKDKISILDAVYFY